jgi:hypothetical protein
LACACSPAFDPPPRPAEVSHFDITTKQAHINNVKKTLEIFRASARDLRSRQKPEELRQLTGQAEHYIKLQVQPLVEDFEADSNLTTRVEIAKLQLLSGMVILELDQPEWKLYKMLRTMEQRYSDQPDVLNAAIDRNEFGFSTIGDGMRSLEELRFRR